MKPGSVTLGLDDARASRRLAESGTRAFEVDSVAAGVDAADAQVAALGEAERVVERDLVGLAARRSSAGAASARRGRARRRRSRGCEAPRIMARLSAPSRGPPRRQSSAFCSLRGPARWSRRAPAPRRRPGSACTGCVRASSVKLVGALGRAGRAPAPCCRGVERVEDVWDARDAAQRVVAARVSRSRRTSRRSRACRDARTRSIGALSRERLGRLGERAARVPTSLAPLPKSIDLRSCRARCRRAAGSVRSGRQVVVCARRWTTCAQVAHRRAARRARAAAARRGTGRASCATGLDASTSGSTSSSAARRSTNVVFAWRMNGGQRAQRLGEREPARRRSRGSWC